MKLRYTYLAVLCPLLLVGCARDPLPDDALGSARKNVMVSDNSEGLLKGTRKIEVTRICFYLVNSFYGRCSQSNMVLELSDTNDISEFLVLLHKNAEYPRLKADQRRRYDMVVAIYGANDAEIVDSVIYISRGHEDMMAWYEAYTTTGETLGWEICGGGKTVNRLVGWLKEKKIDLWY